MKATSAIKRLSIPVIACGVAVLALTGGASAHQSKANGQELSSKPGVIVAKGGNKNLRFSSTTIDKGAKLKIVNQTGAPHTLSLVKADLVPQTKNQIKHCAVNGHQICNAIGGWHKFDGQNIHRNPVRAGKPGWNTEGGTHRLGDSVFFVPGQNPASRRVRAPHGTVLHFICAIHPWMNGTITVN